MTAPRRSRPRPAPATGVLAAACLAVAVASLAVPATLGYDPWAWLVWGREVGRWSLDTSGGPSWKPLPVAVTTLLAPLGELAVPAYTVLARAAALGAVVAVGRLGMRLGGRVAAGAAVVALVLTPDGDPRFVRLVLEGHEAPWSAGLAAAALIAAVDRRWSRSLWWTWLLALLRPEAWPFLAGLAAWVAVVPAPSPTAAAARAAENATGPAGWAASAARAIGAARRWASRTGLRSPTARWAMAALASIPVLWFVPDWIGSGSPLQGAGHAQVGAGKAAGTRLADAVATFAGAVPAPVWVLAAVAVVAAQRRGDPVPARLAGAALAWSGLVVVMAFVLGYAAISRFFLPAAAVACALAGLGLGTALDRATSRPRRVVAVVLGLAAVAALVPRVLGVPDVVAEVADRGRLEDDLDATIEAAGGARSLARCGAAVVTGRTLLRSAGAWKLDLPMPAVHRVVPDARSVLLLESEVAVARARARPGTEVLARGERWTVLAHRCDEGSHTKWR